MIYITSDMMNEYGYIDAAGIQKFLEHIGSWLSKFTLGDRPFSQWLADMCGTHEYEPIFWLAFMQKEQSLTEAKVAPIQKKIDWVLGYGCPESGGRDETYKGFEKQFYCEYKDKNGKPRKGGAMAQFKNYETWSPIVKWATTTIMLFDSPKVLAKFGVQKYIKAGSKEDAKNFLYNPRIEGVAGLSAIWQKYYKICLDLKLIETEA